MKQEVERLGGAVGVVEAGLQSLAGASEDEDLVVQLQGVRTSLRVASGLAPAMRRASGTLRPPPRRRGRRLRLPALPPLAWGSDRP